MKKIILAVLVCSLFSCELSENKKSAKEKVAIYDNNFERKLIELKYDDIIDGYVSKDGIKYCRDLDLSNLGLFDLKGIEAFDSLRSLNVSVNQLKKIDITRNKNLKRLKLSHNHLDSLDISKNFNLNNLIIDQNQLDFLEIQFDSTYFSIKNIEIDNNIYEDLLFGKWKWDKGKSLESYYSRDGRCVRNSGGEIEKWEIFGRYLNVYNNKNRDSFFIVSLNRNKIVLESINGRISGIKIKHAY